MAKGFKHGGGGGSASSALNFKIAGGAASPSGATENTIWVNTEEEITSWVISPVEPESPTEGMVWICVGAVSAAAFNALKKNSIMVYPISAKQYLGGAWVTKTAQSYQNGAWVDWLPDGAIYYMGNLMADTTGGWTSYAYKVTTAYGGVTASVVNNDANLETALTLSTTNRSTFVSTADAIDLTEINSAEFEFESIVSSRTDGSTVMLKVYDENGNYVKDGDTVFSAAGEFTAKGSVDVSGLSGKYRVGYMMWAQASGVSITAKLKQAVLKK